MKVKKHPWKQVHSDVGYCDHVEPSDSRYLVISRYGWASVYLETPLIVEYNLLVF